VKQDLVTQLAGLSPWEGANLAREYLQAQVLASLQRAGAMVPLAFRGGTALRFLFGIPRYSEDLDFALERSPEQYDPERYARAIERDLRRQGYTIETALVVRRTVHVAWVRFPGLPYELGLSPRRTQRLAVKLEVDTRPPEGANLETTLVRRHLLLHLQHHDRASLLAGKLHALLQRSWAKGRDAYDLLWYLSDPEWPAPNLVLLNHALAQTGWTGTPLEPNTWAVVVAERISNLDWQAVTRDVQPFLPPEQAQLLTRENLLSLLSTR